MTITYKRIEKTTVHGYSYHFEVTKGDLVTLASSERDVASSFRWAGLEVPIELQGPYDGYGHKI